MDPKLVDPACVGDDCKSVDPNCELDADINEYLANK